MLSVAGTGREAVEVMFVSDLIKESRFIDEADVRKQQERFLEFLMPDQKRSTASAQEAGLPVSINSKALLFVLLDNYAAAVLG